MLIGVQSLQITRANRENAKLQARIAELEAKYEPKETKPRLEAVDG